ncbi:hypothetical protein DN752_18030 [Echinicola strongylocentroti]|uniref:Uncharacterized protein n=1 Tax=Echinicola strongylocentroti TaxID=1795355 RepID=A0A2Z4IMC0_9BACT|nr:hypothetical protein [Echinicola strongylocentroti]AWW31880.1 hypothetical protein DN752_18030 [Echinicola strongylocentroti]
MIAIRVKELFEEAGIEEVRPTEEALRKMGMSRRRFTQLTDNVNKTPISVPELEAIKEWIAQLREIEPDEIIGQSTVTSEIKNRFGLTK